MKMKQGGMGDEKQKELFNEREELSSIAIIPPSFFGKEREVMLLDGDADDVVGRDHGTSSAGLDYLRNNTQSVTGDITIEWVVCKGLGQHDKGSRVVCSAYGLILKFKQKNDINIIIWVLNVQQQDENGYFMIIYVLNYEKLKKRLNCMYLNKKRRT